MDPRYLARQCPAFWLPSRTPSTIILNSEEAAIALLGNEPSTDPRTLAAKRFGDGLHLVIGARAVPHRVWVRRAATDDDPEIVVIPDQWAELRTAAVDRFLRFVRGRRADSKARGLRPEATQAARLHLMIEVLDALAQGREQATARAIAERVVYRHTVFGSAAEWKSSSHRRQTHRLIRRAVAIRDGGYLQLLNGCIPQ